MKNWAQHTNVHWAPLVTQREGYCLFPGLAGKGENPANAGIYARIAGN